MGGERQWQKIQDECLDYYLTKRDIHKLPAQIVFCNSNEQCMRVL